MTEAELSRFLRNRPVAYHMAERGGWPSIRRHGLLSTSALLDLWEVESGRREAIEAMHRPDGVVLHHPRHGRAVVRDQKPMSDAGLRRCLGDGLTPPDWYRLLNARVFFWLTPVRLRKLLGARPYRDSEHDVLELDTASLVEAYRGQVTLSPINSGAIHPPNPAPRGADTFLTIDAYPYGARRRPVAELCIAGGVPDAARFVRRVTVMRNGEELASLFEA